MASGQKKTRDLSAKDIPVHAPDKRVAQFSLAYLAAFGYLKKELDQWDDITLKDIVAAIGQFQGMFGLRRTKTLDVKTVRAMEAPRCGCPDVVRRHHVGTRGLRDATKKLLPKWKKSGITYKILDYLPNIPKADMDAITALAFADWAKHGKIEISATAEDCPDIIISYGRGKQSNFDGPGGTLAWAYLPNGDDSQLFVRFDLDETWAVTPSSRGILLRNVACHEFGHLLGLDHSRSPSALMAPYYNAAVAEPQPLDDIPRFQARYGVREVTNTDPHEAPLTRLITIQAEGKVHVDVNGERVACV